MPIQTKSFSDLITFTRASNATYFDSTGMLKRAASNVSRIDYNPSTLAVRGLLVEESRTNLITYSEDFNNSAWTKTRCSILANITTAPNGSLSADKLIENTDNNTHAIDRYASGLTGGATYTETIFVKAAERTRVVIGSWDGTTGIDNEFNLSTGTVVVSGAGTIAASIDSVGSGWYRCRVTRAIAAGATQLSLVVYTHNGTTNSYTGDGTSGLFIWGAQLEAGEFATSYIPSSVTFSNRTSTGTYFDSAGVLQTAGSGVSRTTYNPSNLTADPFLLLEESRTNSIRNNTMVGAVAGTPGTNPTNWDITSSGTGITQQIVGTGIEDGITYIDVRFFGIGSGSASPQIRPETTTQIVAASGQTWTSSYYLRIVSGSTTGCSGTFQQIWQERDAAGVSLNTITVSISDPTTAALRTQSSILTRTLTDAGTARLTNRIQWTFDNGVAVDITLRIGMPQLEQGAYSTSVIPTSSAAVTRAADTSTSATATRAADTLSIGSLDPWYNENEGTLFVQSNRFAQGSSGQLIIAEFGKNVNNNDNIIQLGSQFATTNFQFLVNTDGVNQVAIVETGTTAVAKYAAAYKTNDFAYTKNGQTPVTDTSGSIPNVSQLNIGSRPAFGSTGFLNGHIQRLIYYPRRLTNAELQAITT